MERTTPSIHGKSYRKHGPSTQSRLGVQIQISSFKGVLDKRSSCHTPSEIWDPQPTSLGYDGGLERKTTSLGRSHLQAGHNRSSYAKIITTPAKGKLSWRQATPCPAITPPRHKSCHSTRSRHQNQLAWSQDTQIELTYTSTVHIYYIHINYID